ncbi:MAG TPA: hypothetical protein ENF32_06010 [Thermosulfidibacter takaii]|uniref:DUF4258 domain-containing protein n=1 Tax=Thermosulfidibacter takaii TaxID=412593 RepID=A0A7C0U705_9BACT|nr:hypothetical protein [Thermosulfidibacter takaii]
MLEHLSDHFVRRYRQRLGKKPSLAEVKRIIQESVRVQGTRVVRYKGKPFLVPSIYVHPRGIILKVDEMDGTAITILVSDKNGNGRRTT